MFYLFILSKVIELIKIIFDVCKFHIIYTCIIYKSLNGIIYLDNLYQ